MANEKKKMIGICIAEVDQYTQMAYLDTFCRYAGLHNCKLAFFTSFKGNGLIQPYIDGENQIYSLINYDLLDALVVFAETIKEPKVLERIIASAHNAGIPVITIDHYIAGCYNIVFDYREAMRQLVESIVSQEKYKKIEYIGGMPNNSASEERLDVFERLMEKYGRTVDPKHLHYGYFWAGPTEEVMDVICARSPEEIPDAIICANDAMAIVACRRIQEIGLKVPGDVAITGFDGITEALDHSPSLTTACLDIEKAVSETYRLIESVFDGNEIPEKTVLTYRVMYGESTGGTEKGKFSHYNESVQKLYRQLDNHHTFVNHIMNMTVEMSECKNFEEATVIIEKHIPLLFVEKAWLCLRDGYVNDNEDMLAFLKNANKEETEYTERMNCLFEWPTERKNIVFKTSELLPDWQDQIESCNYLLFAPIHVLKDTIGYLVFGYVPGINEFYQMQNFINFLSSAIDNVKKRCDYQKMIEQLENQSTHDALTGILNRRGFFQQMHRMYQESLDSGKKIALYSIDMDGLKYVNDKFGHDEGDMAIIFIALALEKSAQGLSMFCARIGGDEFIVGGVINEAEADEFEKRLQEEFDQYNANSGKAYKLAYSLGKVFEVASRNNSVESFITMADMRMYQQKEEHHKSMGKR